LFLKKSKNRLKVHQVSGFFVLNLHSFKKPILMDIGVFTSFQLLGIRMSTAVHQINILKFANLSVYKLKLMKYFLIFHGL